jgi:ribosomal protein L34E
MKNWKCDGCGEILQGIIDNDGDFISDRELQKSKNWEFQSVGCYLCGCPTEEFLEDVDEDEEVE